MTDIPAAENDSQPTIDVPEGDSTPDQNQGLVQARDRYRGERDSAREELAAAQTRIDAMHRCEVERLAAEHLAVPADFWLSENSVADYLTEAGEVDADRVAEDVRLLISERPRLGKHSGAFDPSQGLGINAPVKAGPRSLGEILRS